ncbi:MAG: EcsC family protein [Planctomycetota bacterium]|nr:EcsC family protein [Planctomycetota bacterium]
MQLTEEERRELARARRLLERRGLLIKLTGILGKPIEKSIELLPGPIARGVGRITRDSLEKALNVALSTLGDGDVGGRSSDRRHKLATAASGAVGGWFGLAGLAFELPVTTVLMLRSIADIARSEGHDLSAVDTQLACLEVFALGGPSKSDDAAETGYYAVRAALAKSFADVASYVAERGAARGSAPAIMRLLDKIATRFGIVVQDKLVLEAVPIIGAASGALINTVFLSHFQDLARGHFIVRRLEGRHGQDAVMAEFEVLEPRRLAAGG